MQLLPARVRAPRPTAPALVAAVSFTAMLAATGVASADTLTPPYRAATADVFTHHFDEVYYVQPHNTYDHGTSLRAWLDAGYRSVELDVIDRGDWELQRLGPYVSHDSSPGQKNCSSGSADDRLGHCLDDIRGFLADNPDSPPILVLVDMKASWDPLNAWKGDEVAMLDEWIVDHLGDDMYRYDQLLGYIAVRSDTPRALLAERGWPRLDSLRGKMIVALTGGRVGSVNQHMEDALVDLYFGYGRYPATFMCPDVESDPDEVAVGGTVDGIGTNNSQFFLCSNLKSRDHYQVTANRAAQNKQIIHLWGDHVYGNTSFTYNYIAVAHGIQAIGQDLANPSAGTTFGGSIPLVGVRRSLPGYFRLKPSHAPSLCMDVEGSYGNGADIQQATCDGSYDKQFVYTAEGQLRPRGNNRYCVDIDGGDAGQGEKMHLWDCDGGNSEKWIITNSGRFRSYDNSAYCMDATASTASGQDWETYGCGSYDEQRFWLEAVADWPQSTF
ncbi:ricin-type beta-trefoil lectin domain protein [Haliangium sp.]|uniref:ricin-type beta-trefoil lectin domain protein n=1 Tax=Haliangium sp. TaxID=2663208 RepID=UPI003D10C715